MELLNAKQYLESQTENKRIINYIEDFVYQWNFKCRYDLIKITKDVDELVDTIQRKFFKKTDEVIAQYLYCVVHHIIFDTFMPVIRAKYTDEDKKIYDRCLTFCKTNKISIQIDVTAYCSVPYTAAIVELSMWDSYSSPLEKLNCLCATYDIIFAEFKSAMVNVISKYSNKEIELPIMDNKDVIPIIIIVLLKSKIRYAYSNLQYIKLFGIKLIEDTNKYILDTFEQAILTILNTDKETDFNISACSNIDFCEAIENITKENFIENTPSCEINFENENRKRLVTLIIQSTTSNLSDLNLL
ncbi:uncharacterized protein LOC130901813 isoform X2 [Diorhabda carinulata]|uniref:uncharacterized protein LOC130901813 isoform X2 n=1 Tax=Diorhabda carinulata TaxID=1163345 RepID=UPI0025A2012E|nr:uncharacterized protein LOC130901813 isoform X2 [Diorhabda carinulata]